MHKNRTWCVEPATTPEALASNLATRSWCCCAGFEIGQYVFLNDATSEDGAQEYAVLKKPTKEGELYVQIESVTASWINEERLLEFICRTLAGENDQVDWAIPVSPRIESAEQHERCHLCA
jgi:hypothetical protein